MPYTTKEFTDTPTGLTFDIFYRLINLDLDNVGGGKAGTLKPALATRGPRHLARLNSQRAITIASPGAQTLDICAISW